MTNWIKLRKKLLSDPRVVVMASKLGTSRYAVLGALFAIWCVADEHGEFMAGLKVSDLSSMISWPGFAETMPEDWLAVSENGLRFPKYNAHNGSTARARIATATRVKRYRKRQRNGASVTPSVTPALPEENRIEDTNTALPSPDKPVRKVKPHWGETLIKPFLDLPGVPKSGPWAYLNKIATEYARPNVEAALRQAMDKRFDTWGHLCGWLVEVAKRAGRTAPAQNGPSW